LLRSATLACFGWVLAASTVFGQERTASVTGRITDRSTGRAIAGAQLILLSNSRSVMSDSAGNYAFQELNAGAHQFLIRAQSFPAMRIIVPLAAGESVVRHVILDSTEFGRQTAAQTLPQVSVSAPAQTFNYRLFGFEQRRKTGRGQYLTEEDILKSGAYTLPDAVKNLRGMTYECGGGSGCFVRVLRAPMRCLPEYIIDGQVTNDFGPFTPIRDIVALEVYLGPSDVPGEFAGTNAGCGAIVVWTRSGKEIKKRR